MQTINIDDKKYVLLPKEQYDQLTIMAQLPAFPEPDEQGNYPAVRTVRALIARKLILRRTTAGLSQRELAKKAGVRFESISRIETGKTSPKVSTMDKIDRALSAVEKKKKRQ